MATPFNRTRQEVSLVPAARTATPIGHKLVALAFLMFLSAVLHHTEAPALMAAPVALASSNTPVSASSTSAPVAAVVVQTPARFPTTITSPDATVCTENQILQYW
jgi:hypothetical protein